MADNQTFDPSLADPISRVRQKLGDTGQPAATASKVNGVDVADATISALLNSQGLSETAAAAELARNLAMKYAKMADTTVDHQTMSFSKISGNFYDLARRLQSEADSAPKPLPPGDPGPAYGGIIVTGGPCDYSPSPCWSPLGFLN